MAATCHAARRASAAAPTSEDSTPPRTCAGAFDSAVKLTRTRTYKLLRHPAPRAGLLPRQALPAAACASEAQSADDFS